MLDQPRPGFQSLPRIVHPVLMGLCATLMGLEALSTHLPWIIATVTLFTGTFVTYFLATLTPSIDLNPPSRIFQKGVWCLLLIPPVAFIIFSLRNFLPETLVLQYLGAGLIGILYFIRVETGQFHFNGLRSVFLLKNITLALAWSLTTAPVDTMQAESIRFFIYRFSFIMALSTTIDLRDMEDDEKNGIPTIPLLTGFGVSCLTACLLLLAGYMTLIFDRHQSPGGQELAMIAGITSATAACSVVFIYFYRNKQFIRWAVDGNLLLHGLVFLIHNLKHGAG